MAKPKKKPKSGQALTAEKREQLYQTYFKHGTIQSVADECTICKVTAMKYKKLDKWDERVEKTKQKAAKKVDNSNAERVAVNLQLVRFTKNKLMAEIKEGLMSKSKIKDLDHLIRLEEFLCGAPDSRPDTDIYIGGLKLPDNLKDM